MVRGAERGRVHASGAPTARSGWREGKSATPTGGDGASGCPRSRPRFGCSRRFRKTRSKSASARSRGASGWRRAPSIGSRSRWSRKVCWSRTVKTASTSSALSLFRLGALVRRRMNVSNEARPYLYDLREKINKSVHLAILDETEIMYVYNLEGTHAIRMRSDIGVRKPAYCTAEGQAILAFQPNDVVDRVIEAGLDPRTPKTITSAEKFIKALGATRQRGCAIEDEESEIGMVCIAAPIRDDSGDVVAAVGIAGPLARLSKKSIAAVMPHVIATADLVSARLGYRGRTQA